MIGRLPQYGHVLTNANVWSHDGKWIVYDVRSRADGSIFDGDRIERVNVGTGEVQVLYRAEHGAKCGVATCSPVDERVVFILGPERPTADWEYGPAHRQGVVWSDGRVVRLEARDLAAPYTPGALRGGSHVHVFSADGEWVSFTYNDAVVHSEQRNVGVSVFGRAVTPRGRHARNHDGSAFSVLVTQTAAQPRAGSDEIRRAFEDAWVGDRGYVRADGMRQRRAIAFQGEVITGQGEAISELFVADLPEDLTVAGDGLLEGTAERLPSPPSGVVCRRLTRTEGRAFPGLVGSPRHWVRSSPDGSAIACLMKDEAGVVQIFLVSPRDGEVRQLTRNAASIGSAFTWSPDGRRIAHVMDGSVCVTDVASGRTQRVTERERDGGPGAEACVFSPDGERVAFTRVTGGWNQVFVVEVG